MFNFVKSARFAILGVILATVLPPLNWPPYLALIIMIPLLDSLRKSRWGARFSSGLFFGLGYFLVLLKWLSVVGPDAVIALSFICALWWAMASSISTLFIQSRFWALWFATSWTALEILRDRLPWGGFGWGQIGIIWLDTPFAAFYATFGQIGMTFLTYLSIAVIYLQIRHKSRRGVGKSLIYGLGVFTTILLAVFLSQNYQPVEIEPNKQIDISAIQGGVERTGLGVLGQPRAVLNKHVEQTENSLSKINKTDLLVWPESSVDLDPYEDTLTLTTLKEIDEKVLPPILIGTTLHSKENLKQNTSLLLQSQSLTWVYQKRHLVPFGEFLPLRSVIEKYTDRASLLSTDYESGKTSGEIVVNGVKLALLICFEIADDSLMVENIGRQSAILVQTNNATYQNLGQSEQQSVYTRIRAIETKRPILSIATSGISLTVNADGEVTQQLSQAEIGLINMKVVQISGTTLATKSHNFVIWLIEICFFGGLILAAVRRFKMAS
jgi:apolipoprotein N-acyltransferase